MLKFTKESIEDANTSIGESSVYVGGFFDTSGDFDNNGEVWLELAEIKVIYEASLLIQKVVDHGENGL